MKQKLALLCAAALLLSACAQSAGQPGADVSGAESGASAPADGVYENCRILTTVSYTHLTLPTIRLV